MTFSALSRTGFAVALAAALGSVAAPAVAQIQNNSIFSQVEPAARDRMFFRINYIRGNVKTMSGDARDAGAPVIARGELRSRLGTGAVLPQYPAYTYPYGGSGRRASYNIIGPRLDQALTDDANDPNVNCETVRAGVGTPCGVRARGASMVGTPAISMGYYLDDEYSWVLEAYVLAAPMSVDIIGDGPTQVNGQKLIKLKLLPPTAVLSKYFGSKSDKIRPFLGLGASYAMFFDVRATDFMNSFAGGASAGDTTVTIKNAMGFGPFIGFKADLDDSWHMNFSVGKLRYKTEATLVTNNTTLDRNSLVLKDLSPRVQVANDAGDGLISPNGITTLLCDLASARAGVNTCNLGTYVRKQSTVLDNTLFTVGVGRSF